MNREEMYELLDIDKPEEFVYFENMANLLEADEVFDPELLEDLFKEVNVQALAEITDGYFDELLKMVSDEETEFYTVIDEIKRHSNGLIFDDMTDKDIAIFVDNLLKFRKWYVINKLVVDNSTGEKLNVRDALYGIKSAEYVGDKCDYNFNEASDYDLEGYSVSVQNMVSSDYEETDEYDDLHDIDDYEDGFGGSNE